jgi:hypothetical protein
MPTLWTNALLGSLFEQLEITIILSVRQSKVNTTAFENRWKNMHLLQTNADASKDEFHDKSRTPQRLSIENGKFSAKNSHK